MRRAWAYRASWGGEPLLTLKAGSPRQCCTEVSPSRAAAAFYFTRCILDGRAGDFGSGSSCCCSFSIRRTNLTICASTRSITLSAVRRNPFSFCSGTAQRFYAGAAIAVESFQLLIKSFTCKCGVVITSFPPRPPSLLKARSIRDEPSESNVRPISFARWPASTPDRRFPRELHSEQIKRAA